MIRQDYIVRLIEQCAQALSQMLRQRQAGELEPALQTLRDAEDTLLGDRRPVVDRLEASSAVSVAGADLVRLYAGLLGEEGLIYQARGDSAQAHLACRRAAELYAAVSMVGTRLDDAELNRVATILTIVSCADCEPRYGGELTRLQRLSALTSG